MKHLLLTTIAAVVLLGCGESQQSAPPAEAKPAEPVAESAQPEPPRAKAPDISIHDAVEKGNIEVVKQHIAAGTDVNAKGGVSGGTPLLIAVTLGHKEIVELLIAKGADVNAKNRMGGTPLHFSASGGHKEVAELLIAKGADVNAKDFGTTPLDKAIGYPKLAGLLRKHGGKHSTINMAAQAGDIEAVKEFLAAGSDVNAKSNYDLTPLHYAATKEVAELLIAKGADVNAKSKFGMTSLHYAAKRHKEIVELLIAKGVNVNAKNNNEWTPLHFAANGGHKEIVEILITEGAEVNAKEEDGRTPLDWAKGERRRGPLRHPETADHLRKHGGKTWKELEAAGKPPEPVAKVVSQSTPAPPTEEKPAEPVTEATQPKPPTTKTPDVSLWDAAMFGKIEAAKKAIADGANVNAKKDDGETPLHWATVEAMDSASKKVIELLISKGADVNAKIVAGRKKGMTPLAIANMFSNKEIADFLRKHGGKTRKELKAEGK